MKKNNMIKVGVIGVGHLGSIHLKLLKESIYYDLIGCFDTNKNVSKNNSELMLLLYVLILLIIIKLLKNVLKILNMFLLKNP